MKIHELASKYRIIHGSWPLTPGEIFYTHHKNGRGFVELARVDCGKVLFAGGWSFSEIGNPYFKKNLAKQLKMCDANCTDGARNFVNALIDYATIT